jgi:magnesium transporter
MPQKKTNRSQKAGLPPGTLMYLGEQKVAKTLISTVSYDVKSVAETKHADLVSAIKSRDRSKLTWLNIDGLHDTELIAAAGKEFNLHPLLLEDILNTDHRPKVEEFDDHLFVSLKMISVNAAKTEIESEQLSLILGENWLISFQEQEGDVFGNIRERLRDNVGLLRQKNADYLLYRLIDTVVDHYFIVIEHIVDKGEALEKAVLESSDQEMLSKIQQHKKELMNLKRAIFPLREIVSSLLKEDNALIEQPTFRYLRDVYEHIVHMNDSLESSRESAANIMDLYLSGVNNKMNEVMKVLTMISTIFIPLSFIVGLYGMNFENIPELHYEYGYYAVWVVFIIAVSGMI